MVLGVHSMQVEKGELGSDGFAWSSLGFYV